VLLCQELINEIKQLEKVKDMAGIPALIAERQKELEALRKKRKQEIDAMKAAAKKKEQEEKKKMLGRPICLQCPHCSKMVDVRMTVKASK